MDKVFFSHSPEKGFTVSKEGNGFKVNSVYHVADCLRMDSNLFHIIINNKGFKVEVLEDSSQKQFLLRVNGKRIAANYLTPLDQLLASMGMATKVSSEVKELKAPMPGLILKLLVDQKKMVKIGDPILILEAMKMENVIKSPVDGEVKNIRIVEGQSVAKNQILVDF